MSRKLYKTPILPANVGGQDRGNSGVYLKGMYEMQVLDTYGQAAQNDGCGSVYEVSAPLVVACFKCHPFYDFTQVHFSHLP